MQSASQKATTLIVANHYNEFLAEYRKLTETFTPRQAQTRAKKVIRNLYKEEYTEIRNELVRQGFGTTHYRG